MRIITKLIIHCSATKPNFDVDIRDVDQWHRERGFAKVGYHYFVKRDGTVQIGRFLHERGAHTLGQNKGSIGVCYAGGVDENGQPEDNRTEAQKQALRGIVRTLSDKFDLTIHGHNEFSNKSCPCFDVAELR